MTSTTRSALAFAGLALVGSVIVAFLVALDGCAADDVVTRTPAATSNADVDSASMDLAGLAPAERASPAGVRPPPPAPVVPARPEVAASVSEWDDAWTRALVASAAKYEGLAKWCLSKKLEFTGIHVRRLVLRYLPDDEAARTCTGDVRAGEGRWVRDDARREAIRMSSDIEDPRAQKFPEKRASTDKAVAAMWKALAYHAQKSAAADPENAAEWTARAAKAWERVLEVDAGSEEAHKALGHPKFNGRYSRPEALAYHRVRDERRRGGQARAAMSFATEPVGVDGAFAAAGLSGVGARSAHCIVNTVHGADVAARLCVWSERARADFAAVYGAEPGSAGATAPTRFNIVKDKDQKQLLMAAAARRGAQAEPSARSFGGDAFVANGESSATSSGGADADDVAIHFAGHALAQARRAQAVRDLGTSIAKAEDWLVEAIACDVTRRLTGTTIVTCGALGRYGADLDVNPARDLWIDLAKGLVEFDDDVPLARLCACTLENQELGGPETVKGYALLQFLFEWDTVKARAFIRAALARGTPAAVAAVYGVPMDEIDARYREWLRLTW